MKIQNKNLIYSHFRLNGFFFGAISCCPLYSQLIKTTAEKPCFSKSGDAASIRARDLG
ncbi:MULTISPECIES: hypothetical protein [unclassified Flavobacterium]|uniref:hypothetical protein n=1 Tax=unclassified Flavobacterium TaxID=196869 RepID=UPI0013159079|nr:MULTISPECIES: hypothetical protein [unclassified Flavobacterium]